MPTALFPMFKRAAVGGAICAAVFLPIQYVTLNAYIAVTVSVGPIHRLTQLIKFALVAGTVTAFVAGFVSQVALQTLNSDGS